MRNFPIAALAGAMLLASCAPRPAPPAPAPPPPVPAPAPPPAPVPPAADWRDAALSPGDWTYRMEGGAPMAVFGSAQGAALLIRCEAGQRISLVRPGAIAATTLSIRTTFGERSLPATAQSGGATATLTATDPLLDQMMYSRGRFLIRAEGVPDLMLPSWPEPARVIEDCRG